MPSHRANTTCPLGLFSGWEHVRQPLRRAGLLVLARISPLYGGKLHQAKNQETCAQTVLAPVEIPSNNSNVRSEWLLDEFASPGGYMPLPSRTMFSAESLHYPPQH
jgi:hypothetical protein